MARSTRSRADFIVQCTGCNPAQFSGHYGGDGNKARRDAAKHADDLGHRVLIEVTYDRMYVPSPSTPGDNQ